MGLMVRGMMCFVALLVHFKVGSATSLPEHHLTDAQRLMRMETEPEAPAAVELSAKGIQQQVKPAAIQSAFDAAKQENFQLSADNIVSANDDDTASMSKEQWEKFKAPVYPCTWNVQVSRADKGPQVPWRTLVVKGAKDDAFHFRGCTTQGEEAFVCQHAEGAQGGVRLMRNSKDEVIGFGACCKPQMVNGIMAAKMGQCGPVIDPNASAWFASDDKLPALQQSGSVVLRTLIVIGSVLFVAISSVLIYRFKK